MCVFVCVCGVCMCVWYGCESVYVCMCVWDVYESVGVLVCVYVVCVCVCVCACMRVCVGSTSVLFVSSVNVKLF